MGAKQSKRSVDISGKEAESAGEVAASIAGGEGRLEQLADADALKPQLNGDAHIHEAATEEKQKDVDSGTPENEKDATTEKEGKQDAEPEVAPLTNGESEQKVENGGETTPTSEDGKKPKKEKVKKKWSLRSISFSRKDKPKQEKKSKDEEAKTNGEPEKVPEETAEVAPAVPVITETAEEAKTPSETKEDKTPETPVTEPITNGTSTPESPKVETPVVDEPVVAAPSPVNERPELKTDIEPEKLPINGLSLEEPVKEILDEKKDDSKEETMAETTESVPEISVKKEVCVDQMPLIDSTPPPLPDNPPPSSVATFAATTMAPELTVASLANTADNAIPPLSVTDSIKTDENNKIPTEPKVDLTITQSLDAELRSPQKAASEKVSSIISEIEEKHDNNETVYGVSIKSNSSASVENVTIECTTIDKPAVNTVMLVENVTPAMLTPLSQLNENIPEKEIENEQSSEFTELPVPTPSEVIEERIIEKTMGNEIISETGFEMPSPPLDLLNENKSENEKAAGNIVKENGSVTIEPASAEIIEEAVIDKSFDKLKDDSQKTTENECLPTQDSVDEKVISNETAFDNTDTELPPPPSEIIEQPITEKGEYEIVSENMDPDLPAPPVRVVEESAVDNNIEKYDSSSISESELPPPPAEDSETDLNVENLHTPPPSLCEEVVSISVTPKQNDVIFPETNKIVVNIDSKHDNAETSSDVAINNTDDIEQNLKNKSKDSLGNFIDTIECNGNVREEKNESVDVIAPNSTKEIADIEIDDSGLLTAASRDETSDEHAGLEPAIPQDPVSDKLADLIPEVPEVPQIITETVVETTSDVAVAN